MGERFATPCDAIHVCPRIGSNSQYPLEHVPLSCAAAARGHELVDTPQVEVGG
jgi:hypothetical protein